MAYKSGQLSALFILLLFQSHCVSCSFNDCGVQLDVVDVNSAESPIILRYHDARQPYRLDILHPEYLDSECLVRYVYMGNGLVSFSCPQQQLQFPALKDWPDNLSATSLIGSRQGDSFDNLTVFAPEHTSAISINQMSKPAKCSAPVEPTMKNIADDKYQLGYQINALDFLPIFHMSFTDQLSFAHAKILSVINTRPRIDDSKETLRKGLIFKNSSLPISQLGRKSHLSGKLKDLLKTKFPSNAIIEDNHLVSGQLLSKDDLFYIPEQRATFFLENTALIWSSINDGNWKLVGDIVRKLAQETATDLDVYSGTLECLTFDKTSMLLHESSNSTKHNCVPKFLFKIALDKRGPPNRAMVFITVNDPSIEISDDGSIPSDYKFCDKKSECDQLYPEFSSTKKGYTYCCDLQDFVPWNEIQANKVEPEIPNYMPIYEPFGRYPPPPSPPMPPMPAVASSYVK